MADYDPKPLLLGHLEPDDHTILFGDGGTGKGVVASWWIARLTLDGYAVLILDYEEHAVSEWKPRIKGFGGQLDRVLVFQPDKAIWDAALEVEEELAAIRARFPDAPVYLAVDSAAYACKGLEVEKSATATRYSDAISDIGLPTLTLAHVTKTNQDPKHPFGSIFWSNGARLTYGMSSPDGMTRRLEARKANGRPYPQSLTLDWTWAQQLPAGEVPVTLGSTSMPMTNGERAYAVLRDAGAALKDEDILARVNASLAQDGKPPTTIGALRNALNKERGIEKVEAKRGWWKAAFSVARGGAQAGAQEPSE